MRDSEIVINHVQNNKIHEALTVLEGMNDSERVTYALVSAFSGIVDRGTTDQHLRLVNLIDGLRVADQEKLLRIETPIVMLGYSSAAVRAKLANIQRIVEDSSGELRASERPSAGFTGSRWPETSPQPEA